MVLNGEALGTTTRSGAAVISVIGANALSGSIFTFRNRCGLTTIGPWLAMRMV